MKVNVLINKIKPLLTLITSHMQRDYRELYNLRKSHSRPHHFVENSLNIVFKIIERYIAKDPLMYKFVLERDPDEKEPQCVIKLHGRESFMRAMPGGVLTMTFYFGKSIRYVLAYEIGSDMLFGAEYQGGCFLHGGGRMRVDNPQDALPSCCWELPMSRPYVEGWEMFSFGSSALAILCVVSGRVISAALPIADLGPELRFLLQEAAGFVLDYSDTVAVVGEASHITKITGFLGEPSSLDSESD